MFPAPLVSWQAASDRTLDQRLGHAQSLLERGDLKGAEQELQALAKARPDSYLVHNNLGALYMGQGRLESACAEFAAAARLNPAQADVQRNLGACYFQMDEYSKVLEPLRASQQAAPEDLRTRYMLGDSLLMLSRPDQAEPELEFVRARMPGEERTLFALVKLYQQKRDQPRAGAAFAELQQAHPDSVFIQILMGESYDIQERREEAIAEYRKAIAVARDMPRLHFDLGFLLWANNRSDAAKAELQEEVRRNPRFAPARYYLGEIALSENRYAEAAGYFQQTIALNPGCLDAHVGLGKAYFRIERFADAVEEFERAHALDAAQPDVHYWLAMVYRRLQQKEKSEAEMNEYKELSEKKRALPASKQPAQGRWASATCLNRPS